MLLVLKCSEEHVSRETVVLRRWGVLQDNLVLSTGLIMWIWIPNVSFRIALRWLIHIINLADKTKLSLKLLLTSSSLRFADHETKRNGGRGNKNGCLHVFHEWLEKSIQSVFFSLFLYHFVCIYFNNISLQSRWRAAEYFPCRSINILPLLQENSFFWNLCSAGRPAHACSENHAIYVILSHWSKLLVITVFLVKES